MRATLLGVGIAANIAFLGYFKYRNFFLDTSNLLFGTHFAFGPLILPLGISFITFQKIAYLMDVYIRAGQGRRLPRLSPVHALLPPSRRRSDRSLPRGHAATERAPRSDGCPPISPSRICLFSIGLFKKVVIADRVADYANPVFAAPLQGEPVTLLPGWIGALAYTFQIYFDFSGYSDMALGIARIFGVVLPMNFNSPLKASSIVEFWSRWHITLTRFLTALSLHAAGTCLDSSAHGAEASPFCEGATPRCRPS